MEETKDQDDTDDMNDIHDNESSSDVDDQVFLDKKVFQGLKQNDPNITNIIILTGGDCFINTTDWKVDGDCIVSNTHLKKLHIHFGYPALGDERSNDSPTRQQLQDFFSCVYRNNSINYISIQSLYVADIEFSGNLIKGLQGHPSLTRLEIDFGNLGSIGCEALGKVLKHPKSKLKSLRLPQCKLNEKKLVLCAVRYWATVQ